MLQDPNTIQYRFVSAVNKLFMGRWLLTATPILNDLEGLFHMAVLVDPTFSHGNIYAFRKNTWHRVERCCAVRKVEGKNLKFNNL